MARYESTPTAEQPPPPIDPPVDPDPVVDPTPIDPEPVGDPLPPVDPTTPPVDPPPPVAGFDPPGRELPIELGARLVADRATLQTLARTDDVPRQLVVKAVRLASPWRGTVA